MSDQTRLDPVYNQLSAIRDDLSASYAQPPNVGDYGGYSSITAQIMNPALIPPSMPMQGFNAELSLMRYSGAAEMGQIYEDAMRANQEKRNWFEVGMGAGGGLAWMGGMALGSAVGGPIGGMVGGFAASMLFERLRDPLESLFKVNQINPAVTASDWTQGIISEQVMAMAYMAGDLGPGGRAGITKDQAETMGADLYNFMRGQGLQGMEITRIAPYLMRSGILDSSSNLEELTEKVEKQIETIANFVKRTGMRLKDAAQVTSGLAASGIASSDLLGVSTGIINTSAVANMDAAQYAQLAIGFAQPYSFGGNQPNVIASLNREVLFQDYLYQSGAVSQAEYLAAGRAVGAGSTIAQLGMSYWRAPANRRILYGMTADGMLNTSGISAMLAGESFPSSGMDAYNALSAEDRAAIRWQSGDMLNEHAGLFTDVMLSRMIDNLEDAGYHDPFSQRQMLMERYGISRALATQFERREELMFDPRTNLGMVANASRAAAQTSRAQAINEHNIIMQRVIGLGRAVDAGDIGADPYDARQEFISRLLAGEDWETLVQEESSNPDSAMSRYLNADLQSLLSGGRMGADALQAVLSQITPEQRAIYGPRFADAATANLRREKFLGMKPWVFMRSEIGSPLGLFATGSATRISNEDLNNITLRYNPDTGSIEASFGTDPDRRWWDAGEYSFRNLDIDVAGFADAMDWETEDILAAQSRADILSGVTDMMPTRTQILYGQAFQRRAGYDLGVGGQRGAEAIQRAYDVSSYIASAPTAEEARTSLTSGTMGYNDAMDEWYYSVQDKYRRSGLSFTGNASDATDVYDFTNRLSETLFGYDMASPRFTPQDRQRLDYFTSIVYPSIAGARSEQQRDAEGDLGSALRTARARTGGGLTEEELRMRSAVGSRYNLSEEEWSTVSDIMIMSYAEGISLAQAANRLGVDDQDIRNATATIFGTRGAARGAVIAAGENYDIQMAGAQQALERFSYLFDPHIGGRSVTMAEALKAYRRGENVDFRYAEGYADTDLGRLASAVVTTDTLSEETLADLIAEDQRRRGVSSADDRETGGGTGGAGEDFSISTGTMNVTATTVIVSEGTGASGGGGNVGGGNSGGTGTGLTTGSPGDSGPWMRGGESD